MSQTAGMVRLAKVALDAKSGPDNASKRKAMSDARRSEKRVRQRAAPKRTAQRALVGAFLLALTCAGGYAVAMHKTVTLSVDGSPMTVSTMKSRVIDVVIFYGFAAGDHDDLYPAANQQVRRIPTPSCCDAAGRCRCRWTASRASKCGRRH